MTQSTEVCNGSIAATRLSKVLTSAVSWVVDGVLDNASCLHGVDTCRIIPPSENHPPSRAPPNDRLRADVVSVPARLKAGATLGTPNSGVDTLRDYRGRRWRWTCRACRRLLAIQR